MTAGKRIGFSDLVALIANREVKGRVIIAMAGAPGSGKSAVAERLTRELNSQQRDSTAILPMDGFHFDDAVLRQLGLYERKGAPETFDVAGLKHSLTRMRRNLESSVAVPVFDRDLELSRAAARLIPRSVRRVIVEGNYLLVKQEPWLSLHDLFDITIMLDVDQNVLRERLRQRWVGYGMSAAEVARKVEQNDLPNGEIVARTSIEAGYYLDNTG
jgi:pantothenate kinase